jgi:HSP20 family molecular chaperone IbpA
MKDETEKTVEHVGCNTSELTSEGREYIPLTDIYEKADSILVRCDMPGVGEDQIDIRLEHNELEIIGTQEASHREGMDLLSGEYRTGIYRRKFSIPQLIDRDGIQARLRDGVLDIELPKADHAKSRKIEITTRK